MKKLINFRPFVFLAVGLILGIITAKQYICGDKLVGTVLLSVTAGILLFTNIFGGKTFIKRNIVFSLIFIVFSVSGGIMLSVAATNYEGADLNGQYLDVTARIERVEKGVSYDAFVLTDVITEGVADGKCDYKIMLYVRGENEFDVGDIISFGTSFEDISAVYEQKLSSYNIVNKIKYSAWVNANDIAIEGHYLNPLERVNVFIRNSLADGLDEDEFAVAYGMLCGNTEYMDYNLKTSFREAGVAHLFAVSGLHIGFVAGICGFIFKKFRFNKYLSTTITVVVLFLYSGVCGFTPSSLRASVMAGVLFISALTGMKYDGLSSIGIAVSVVLLISPAQLFCAGFQLSFVVTSGIFLLERVFSRLFSFLNAKIRIALSTVLSAQLASIPVSLAHFGEFSLVSVFANVLFIPLASVLFIILIFCCVIGGAFGISSITLFVPNYVLKGVTRLVSSLDYKTFIVGGFAMGAFALCYYAAMIVISGKINFKKITNVVVSSVLTVVCVVGTVVYNFSLKHESDAYIIGDSGMCASLFSVDKNVLVASEIKTESSTARLKRTLAKTKSERVDILIVPRSAGSADVSAVVTKVNYVADISKVYYYDDGNTNRNVLKKSFPDMLFVACEDDFSLSLEDCGFSFVLNGYGVQLNVNEKQTLILSRFGKSRAGYAGLELTDFDLVVAIDYIENIFALCSDAEFVSYRKSDITADAETHGDFWCRLD